jgi:DNA modification methylase
MSIRIIRYDCFKVKTYKEFTGQVDLIVTDPPYGRILNHDWDTSWRYEDYVRLSDVIGELLKPGGTAYVWGGIGKPFDRPFLRWISQLEFLGNGLILYNLITWKKKRAYGKLRDYLFTREECAMLVKIATMGAPRPKTFNIPLLDKKRGYPGYNPKYPAKSEFLRVSNVWDDISELFSGKIHEAEKPSALAERMIRTSSNPGDLVLDLFAGSGSTGIACENVGDRRCVLIEKSDCPMHIEG